MHELNYSCETEKLHPELQAVWEEQEYRIEAEIFKNKKSSFYGIKFIFFVLMSALGIKHYNIMGTLGYDSFLFGEDLAQKLAKKKRNIQLLDIGAGAGSITKKFEQFTTHISCLEPSKSFQEILKKRGYTITDTSDKKTYDIVTLFNVIDVCDNPEEIIKYATQHTDKNGLLIISLPFPIQIRSWDNTKIRKTNQLTQSKQTTFEEAVSDFYIHFLKKHHLKATFFTRLPYIVSLPETQDVSIYDNGLFLCEIV